MPTEVEIVESLFAGLLQAVREDADRKPRRRRNSPSATRYQVLDALREAECEGCVKTRLPDGSGYLIAPRGPEEACAFDYPGRPLRVAVPYASHQRARVFESAGHGKPETSRLVSNAAAIEAVRRLADGIREHREWTAPPPESCFCAVTSHPPCSFCENCSECEECGVLVRTDLLGDHMDDKHAAA